MLLSSLFLLVVFPQNPCYSDRVKAPAVEFPQVGPMFQNMAPLAGISTPGLSRGPSGKDFGERPLASGFNVPATLTAESESPVAHALKQESVQHSGKETPPQFVVHLDFLYWKADVDGLEYGTKLEAPPVGSSSNTHAKLLDLHYKWNPGFCLGIGYIFNHFDHWALDFDWTRIRSNAHGFSSAESRISPNKGTDTIFPPWVSQGITIITKGSSKASAHWNLDYDTLDLALGKNLVLSRKMSFGPYFGLRGAWIEQDYVARYKTFFPGHDGGKAFTRHVHFKADNNFKGVGLRGGTEFVCHLNNHWHVFSNFAGSLLYGKFTVRMKNGNDRGLEEVMDKPTNFTASESFRRVRFNFEESLGLGWESFFLKDRYHFRIRADYELSQWPNQNELFYNYYLIGLATGYSIPIRSHGNLCFQGVRVGLQLDF